MRKSEPYVDSNWGITREREREREKERLDSEMRYLLETS